MAIALRISQGGVFIFDVKITAKLAKGSAIELQPVVGYEGLWHPKSCNYVSPYKIFNTYVPDISQRLSFHPFSEVIHSYQSKSSIARGLGKWTYNVQPPLGKGPGAVDEI